MLGNRNRLTMNDTALWRGKIGDGFVFDSHTSPEQRQHLSTLVLQHAYQEQLTHLLPLCGYRLKFERLWTDTWKGNVLLSRPYGFTIINKHDIEVEWPMAVYDPDLTFPIIARGELSFYGSSFLRQPWAIETALPSRFVVIVDCTPTDIHMPRRAFDAHDWETVLTWLTSTNQVGVVLNSKHKEPRPAHNRVLDLTGKTTLQESIAILKAADGYIGIDSCLGILAAQCFPKERLAIKSLRSHAITWQGVYYLPHTDTSFVVPSIDTLWNP